MHIDVEAARAARIFDYFLIQEEDEDIPHLTRSKVTEIPQEQQIVSSLRLAYGS